MPQLLGLIFDLDGTLLDSAPDLRQAVNHMLGQHKRRDLSLDEVKAMTGDGMMALVERAFAATGEVPEEDLFPYVQEFIHYYRTLTPDPSQVFPHGRETLAYFSRCGVKLGVCTNKQTSATLKILEALDLSPYFAFIAGGDTFLVHKPNPQHLLGTIEGMEVDPASCVFVGDGPNDVIVAQKAGIPSIVMAHGYADDVEELGADKIIAGFDLLPAALKELGFNWTENP
jgi:phosphoglycolate phosphatase